MSRCKGSTVLVFLILFASFLTSLEARNLLDTRKAQDGKKVSASLVDRLFPDALPKGKVPSSSPTRKGHAIVVNQQLFAAGHLPGIDRILRSVPSPGIGH